MLVSARCYGHAPRKVLGKVKVSISSDLIRIDSTNAIIKGVQRAQWDRIWNR